MSAFSLFCFSAVSLHNCKIPQYCIILHCNGATFVCICISTNNLFVFVVVLTRVALRDVVKNGYFRMKIIQFFFLISPLRISNIKSFGVYWLHFYFSSVPCPVPNGTGDLPFQNNALPKKGRRRKNSCCLFFLRRILLCNLLHTSGSCIPLLPISKTIFLFSPPANAHLVICQVVPSVKNVVNIFLPRPLVIHAHLHLPTC